MFVNGLHDMVTQTVLLLPCLLQKILSYRLCTMGTKISLYVNAINSEKPDVMKLTSNRDSVYISLIVYVSLNEYCVYICKTR